MSSPPVHIDIDVDLVRRLLTGQFQQWADLPLVPVDSGGTDNGIFRLGAAMSVRLPKVDWAIGQVHKEQRWLPVLARQTSLEIPEPVALGKPAEGYPWDWSVYTWLEGETATVERMADPVEVATQLGRFLAELHSVDTGGGPPPGEHNFRRGVPLAERDEETRTAIAELEALGDLVDTEAVRTVWDEALSTPAWTGAPVWIHGDLQSGNLLVRDGELTGVIDFGGLAVGDPACDLLVGWNLFEGAARAALRTAAEADDASWLRGRGWALSVALIQLPYYLHRKPAIARNALRTVGEILAEHRDERGASV
ncbi:aminoglycoside phosphotransferase family protein [Streptomyces sp. NPDC058459]|uniref:aminoglycoside phosphotransferase family protein n=1 Tax=Streptomyces sp. NPDC058459 TaxID=3346508 RepID=UPI00364AB1C6